MNIDVDKVRIGDGLRLYHKKSIGSFAIITTEIIPKAYGVPSFLRQDDFINAKIVEIRKSSPYSMYGTIYLKFLNLDSDKKNQIRRKMQERESQRSADYNYAYLHAKGRI